MDKVYTKGKKPERNTNGQFPKYKEVGHFTGTHSGKRRVCACCKKSLEITRNPNALYCKSCAEYIKKLRWRFATANKRMRTEIEEWRKFGCLGRVQQQIKSAQKAKRVARNLEMRLKYYQKKEANEDART